MYFEALLVNIDFYLDNVLLYIVNDVYTSVDEPYL